MIKRLLVCIVSIVAFCAPATAFGRPRGTDDAVSAAERLLLQVGGAEAWQKRTFEVTERGYLRSGEVAEMHIVRDFERGARLYERRTPTSTYVEWVSPEGGWIERDGVRSAMPAEELASELYGLVQEPYTIYHLLAKGGNDLRVELRENGAMLAVYDKNDRFLCWFRLAPNGLIRGWGNFYNGRINEHFYGPFDDFGDVNIARWGAASDGGFRFEYVTARMRLDGAIEPSAK